METTAIIVIVLVIILVIVLLVMLISMWVLLSREDKRDEKRAEQAKQLAEERKESAKELELMRQKHEIEINSMWANAIKSLVDSQEQTSTAIADALNNHEKASQERYKSIGITQDLLKLAKERLEHERK